MRYKGPVAAAVGSMVLLGAVLLSEPHGGPDAKASSAPAPALPHKQQSYDAVHPGLRIHAAGARQASEPGTNAMQSGRPDVPATGTAWRHAGDAPPAASLEQRLLLQGAVNSKPRGL